MSNIMTDIKQISRILSDKEICGDLYPLNNAIATIRDKNGYNVDKLELRIPIVPRNTRPNGVKSLTITLNVSVPQNQIDGKFSCLPWAGYNFSFLIEGLTQNKKVKSAWHLDYDLCASSTVIHPCFHLTFGGKMMENVNLGDVLLLPVPRYGFPPMDIVLGIDFILSNFLEKAMYEEIKQNKYYQAAVRDSQEKFWKPYFLTIGSRWCSSTGFDDKNLRQAILPTLVD